jgi:hypothetical protein
VWKGEKTKSFPDREGAVGFLHLGLFGLTCLVRSVIEMAQASVDVAYGKREQRSFWHTEGDTVSEGFSFVCVSCG